MICRSFKKLKLQQIEVPGEQLIFSHGQFNCLLLSEPAVSHLIPHKGEVMRL